LNTPEFDIVVVGAGINGAGMAQAAAAAGHSVLLLEKQAPGTGTSSRSSKLIHGGLRYLESYEFKLVRESLRERSLLLKLAPDLVQLKEFYLPLYDSARRGPLLIRAGLSLYWLLAAGQAGASFTAIPPRQWDQLDGLRTDGLRAVFRYHDAQTDDVLLTHAVVKSAQDLGARVEYPAEVVGINLEKNFCQVDYLQSGGEHTVTAGVVVNATGPWANQLLACVEPAISEVPVDLIRGTHIVLNQPAPSGFYYVESPRDGRAVFVMPWKGKLMVGTTESRFKGDPGTVKPLAQELRYLKEILAYYFPERGDLETGEIESSFAGLRVLPQGQGHAFHRSREILIYPDRPLNLGPPRLVTLYGGKLTVFRATAEKVMKLIKPSLPHRKRQAETHHLRLS
jgi:glycerol-3-phosphate dehydrogenase